MKKTIKNLTSFKDHLDGQYGVPGTDNREKYEQEFKAFKIYILIEEQYTKHIEELRLIQNTVPLLFKY